MSSAEGLVVTVARDEEYRSVVEAVGRAREMGDVYLARKHAGEGLLLVAWQGGEPLGHAFIAWAGDTAVVEGLIVAEAHRSRGIGTTILARTEAEARRRGCRTIGLGVEVEDNPRAYALYRRLGYAPPCDGIEVPEEAIDRRCTQLWKAL